MAKNSIGQITTAQTFQAWLDKTNQIVTLLEGDVMTASALGDTTTGNSTLVGSFTANTVIASDTLRANTISPKVGSSSISVSSPVSITSTPQDAFTLISTSGPRVQYSSGLVTWRAGFLSVGETLTDNFFTIDTGTGDPKLTLSPSGDLTVTGTVTSVGDITGDLTGNVTGNVTGDLTGNVTGTVSSISNHNTDALSEGSSNLYFTTARARSSISAGTGVSITKGQISIGQVVSTTSNVNFASATLTNSLNIRGGAGNAAIEHGRIDGVSSTPVIDFHSSGNNIDYDSRIIASGGNTTVGSGTIQYIASGGHIFTGSISSTGDVTAFASSSDVRKKENIVRIDNALEKVSQISGYTYNFKGDDRKLAGVIAQELEQVLPEVVYEIDDEEFGRSKAVRYGNIVGLLIEAIKELKAEIEELKNAD